MIWWVSIDFYWLVEPINNNQWIIIDYIDCNQWLIFIEWNRQEHGDKGFHSLEVP